LKTQLESCRQVGKTAVLGLGFGMGALKFMNRLRADRNAAAMFDSGELTPLICRGIVKDYRSRYPKIQAFWKALENAARLAVSGVTSEVGLLRFESAGDLMRIWLPSGRALRYANMRLENVQHAIRYLDRWGMESEFTPEGPSLVYGNGTSLYGGKLTENVAQAAARDLLVEAVLRLEQRGYPVLLHVHDEVVVEVEQARVEEAKHAVEEELIRQLPWTVGLPIGAEVHISARYAK
jgi:DNA polymerase